MFKLIDVRKSYESQVKNKKNNDYEHFRWLENFRRWMGYRELYHALNYHIDSIKFDSVLEVGPGSGIWTKQVIRKNPNARFELVDISKDMLEHCKINLGERKNIDYVCEDFMDYNVKDKKDLFVSIRAFRYIKNKRRFLEKVYDILDNNGNGIIVTWMPRLGKNVDGEPIFPAEFVKMLKLVGFRGVGVYPAVVRVPYFYWNRIYKKELRLPRFFVEAYLVRFRK